MSPNLNCLAYRGQYNETALRQLGYDDHLIKFLSKVNEYYGFEFHGDRNFLDYYAGGSNWPGYSAQWLEEKNRALNLLIDERIALFSQS